jgi:hypothetical protein
MPCVTADGILPSETGSWPDIAEGAHALRRADLPSSVSEFPVAARPLPRRVTDPARCGASLASCRSRKEHHAVIIPSPSPSPSPRRHAPA